MTHDEEQQMRSEAGRAFNRGTIGGVGIGCGLGALLSVLAERWIGGFALALPAVVGFAFMQVANFCLRPSWVRDDDTRSHDTSPPP